MLVDDLPLGGNDGDVGQRSPSGTKKLAPTSTINLTSIPSRASDDWFYPGKSPG
jgi:hypothetical protein